MSATMLDAALAYAARGVAVFPAASAVKKSLKCARFSNGERWGATRDLTEIRRDFTRWPDARIGIPTSAVNGIIVVEVDTLEGHNVDGAIALAKLESVHDVLPETLTAISPSGSIHRYFRHPGDGIKIKGSASELGAGVDIRGDHQMIIAPPSINVDGRAYRWINKVPIAEMPVWLIELTREKPPTIRERAVAAIRRPREVWGTPQTSQITNQAIQRYIDSPNRYGQAALDAEITALANVAPGSRNVALNRASFSLHQLVDLGALDADEVVRQLVAAATANGLVDDDGIKAVQDTIESGRRGAERHPRGRR